MRKICLSITGLIISMFAAWGQSASDTVYKPRKLSFEEANLVSSYYKQDGNNAAVTGGSGSEKLTDIANVIDVKLYKWDKLQRKHSFDVEVGLDHYTSASSDMVDLKHNSSASSSDTRIYPSLTWNMENEKKGNTIGAGVSLSSEYDYTSIGFNALFTKKSKDRNTEFTAKAQIYLDKVRMIFPEELRGGLFDVNGSSSRNTYSGSFSLSRVINDRLQVAVLADVISQQGYLSLPFHRVYFTNGAVRPEHLPDSRMKIPLGLRANYFLGDKLVLRAYYRYYNDDWGVKGHTASLETSIKLTPFFSLTPFYRYYTQTAADYFAPYRSHVLTDTYYTSNYDLSAFNSQFYGAGFRIIPPKGVFGIQHFNMLEVRYGHYNRTTGLNSDIISLNLKYK